MKDDETVVKDGRAEWTPERRAAQSERMKQARKHYKPRKSIPLAAVSDEAKPVERKARKAKAAPDNREQLKQAIIALLALL